MTNSPKHSATLPLKVVVTSGVARMVSGGHDDRGAEGASIEAPKAPSRVGYEEGCPLPSQLGGLRSVVSSLSGVRGAAIACFFCRF